MPGQAGWTLSPVAPSIIYTLAAIEDREAALEFKSFLRSGILSRGKEA